MEIGTLSKSMKKSGSVLETSFWGWVETIVNAEDDVSNTHALETGQDYYVHSDYSLECFSENWNITSSSSTHATIEEIEENILHIERQLQSIKEIGSDQLSQWNEIYSKLGQNEKSVFFLSFELFIFL
jgi:predicted DNA-binding protein YlxM (UPF0122 family)